MVSPLNLSAKVYLCAGMAVFDTMRYIKSDVSTVCVGLAASMGAFILASGQKVTQIALTSTADKARASAPVARATARHNLLSHCESCSLLLVYAFKQQSNEKRHAIQAI